MDITDKVIKIDQAIELDRIGFKIFKYESERIWINGRLEFRYVKEDKCFPQISDGNTKYYPAYDVAEMCKFIPSRYLKWLNKRFKGKWALKLYVADKAKLYETYAEALGDLTIYLAKRKKFQDESE